MPDTTLPVQRSTIHTSLKEDCGDGDITYLRNILILNMVKPNIQSTADTRLFLPLQ